MLKYLSVWLIVITALSCTSQEPTDLMIVNAFIVDGSNAPGFTGDVAIRDGQIIAVGPGVSEDFVSENTIDAKGRLVTPGFIDLHAHGDPLSTPEFQNFLAMGVTTICLGQDGGSTPIGGMEEWFEAIDSQGVAVNIVPFAGHGTLRNEAGVPYGPCPEEKEPALAQLVEEAMRLGCFGLSSGLEYTPGRFATTSEMAAVAKAVGKYDGMIMSHIRNEDDPELLQSIEELIEQGEFCRVHIAHLKSTYGKGAERGQEILDLLNAANQSGVTITADVYPYLASYTGIGIVFPAWAKTTEDFELAKRTRNEELRNFLKNKIIERNGPEATLFGNRPFRGMTLADVAKESESNYVDVLMNLGPESISAAYFIMDSSLQFRLIEDPSIMISSDGSPTMHHPRGYGSFAKILHYFVKTRGSLSYEQAVHKMSGLSAQTLKLEDRGLLRPGFRADINIIDTSEVRDLATFSDPHLLSTGFDYVIVNGQVAKVNEQFQEARHGKLLRRDQAKSEKRDID